MAVAWMWATQRFDGRREVTEAEHQARDEVLWRYERRARSIKLQRERTQERALQQDQSKAFYKEVRRDAEQGRKLELKQEASAEEDTKGAGDRSEPRDPRLR